MSKGPAGLYFRVARRGSGGMAGGTIESHFESALNKCEPMFWTRKVNRGTRYFPGFTSLPLC